MGDKIDIDVKVKNMKFRKWLDIDAGKGRTLGFMGFTLVIAGLDFVYDGVQLRINADDKPQLRAMSRTYKLKNGDAKGEHRTCSSFKLDDALYPLVCAALYAHEDVLAACDELDAREDDGEKCLTLTLEVDGDSA